MRAPSRPLTRAEFEKAAADACALADFTKYDFSDPRRVVGTGHPHKCVGLVRLYIISDGRMRKGSDTSYLGYANRSPDSVRRGVTDSIRFHRAWNGLKAMWATVCATTPGIHQVGLRTHFGPLVSARVGGPPGAGPNVYELYFARDEGEPLIRVVEIALSDDAERTETALRRLVQTDGRSVSASRLRFLDEETWDRLPKEWEGKPVGGEGER